MYKTFIKRLVVVYTNLFSLQEMRLEENANVIKMIKMIIKYHVDKNTKFKPLKSSKIKGIDAITVECENYNECEKIIGKKNINNISILMDYMFFSLKTFWTQIKKAIDDFDDIKIKKATEFTILKNVDLLFYFLFLNTSVIPIVAPEEFHKVLNIDGDKEFMLINKCKTVLRKYSNDFYICDFNPKLDYTQISPSKTFFDRAHDYLKWKKVSSPLKSLFSDNIPVNSPRAALILTSIIVTLRHSKK